MNLVNHTKIVSLKDFPEYRESLIKYVEENWQPVSGPFTATVDKVFQDYRPLPKCYMLLKQNKIIGFYQLVALEPVNRNDLSPWITCLFIDEKERGHQLGSRLLAHGRKIAGKLGFPRVYLTTREIRFYERYGFEEIGLERYNNDRPTKIYSHRSIRL